MGQTSPTGAPRTEAPPPTRNQVNIWLGQQASPDLAVFNELAVFVMEGQFDADRFDRALQHVVARVDALRMVVTNAGPALVLTVLDQLDVRSRCLDLSDAADPEAALDRWAQGYVDTVLDISHQLFSSTLVTLSPSRWAWAFLQHHIATDATSLTIVFEQVSQEYSRLASGEATEPPPQPSFADYLARQDALRSSEQYEQNERFWQDRMADPAEPMVFYDGRSLTSSMGHVRIHQEVTLGVERSQTLRQLASRRGLRFLSEDMSLFGVFATSLLVMLFRMGGQARRTIGAAWQNRTLDAADVVGLLMEQDPFTVEIADDDSFASVARKTHVEALSVMRHLPYAAGNPGGRLYDVALNFVKVSVGPFAGMPAEPRWYRPSHGEGSLLVNVFDLAGSGELKIGFDFNETLFTEEQREATIGQLLRIIDRFIADPDQPITGVEILSESERLRLQTWNETSRTYPRDATTIDLIESQAVTRPTAIAARCGDSSLSYADLDRRAEALGLRLREMGAGPGELVGICLERSLEMLVAVLGVMKSGAAYVPLDPAFPSDRLAFMLQDSGSSVLITQRSLQGTVDASGCAVLEIDELHYNRTPAGSPPVRRAGPDDLAYVLYTSGSTGRPKGVEIPHGALSNFLWSMRENPGCTEDDVALAVTTLSFDISGLELYLPLVCGGQVEIAPRSLVADGRRLRERLDRGGITMLQATPATWRMLLEAGWEGTAGLTALIGGEPLPPDLVGPLVERTRSLWNMYGPTETTIWSSVEHIVDADQPITVGRPIANTTFHVLDRYGMRVPVGVAGELYIGGDGLAIGYHDRPELTSERFLVASLDGEPGVRLYRTGDLVRHLADGRVTHLGRLDSQVKVRGFRIELGEIESVLAEHPSVVRAVVDVRSDSTGAKTLVGYCQTKDGALPDAHELRETLRRSLPDYMVPTHYVLLDRVPLTPNGKVDRSALPDPDHAQRLVATSAVAPRTPVEKQLTQIWSELLGVEQIGIRDDFFDLGGHSLLALQMLTRIMETFGVDLPLQRLFEATTIEAVAALVEAGGDLPAESSETEEYLPALIKIWCEVLDVSDVGPDDDFFALHGDSSLLTEMLVRTRQSLGVMAEGLSEVEFRRTPTVGGLAAMVASNAQRTTSLIVPLRREGQGSPLFLIHAGGGYAFFYRALASQLSGRPLYAIRAESRSDGSGRPFAEESDIESVATRYLAEIQAVQPEGPYLLGGACAGGLIAFEMARQLESRGRELAGPVIVFDSVLSNNDHVSAADRRILRAAGLYPMPRLLDLRQAFSRRLGEARELGVLPGAAHISRAASRRALRALRRRMSRLAGKVGLDVSLPGVGRAETTGATPAPTDRQSAEMAETLGVAIRCALAYHPQPVDVAVVCFEAAETGPLGLTWQGVAGRGLVVIETPGSHLDMLEHPWVEQTATRINEYLSAAQ